MPVLYLAAISPAAVPQLCGFLGPDDPLSVKGAVLPRTDLAPEVRAVHIDLLLGPTLQACHGEHVAFIILFERCLRVPANLP